MRHGQYTKDPTEQLTSLGKKQASLTGKRLAKIDFKKIYSSKLPRAIETANIIIKNFKQKQRFQKKLFLNECIPGFPKKLRKKFGHTDEKKLLRDKKTADAAFNELFKFEKIDTKILIVCHGNIIRYFICKALKMKAYQWLDLDIKQCGICEIKLKSETKKMQLIGHNDVGHIPLKMQTFI